MSDLGTLKSRIRRELNRASLRSDVVVDEIESAIRHYKGKRFIFNSVLRETISGSSGTAVLTISTASSLVQVDHVVLLWPSSTFRESLRQRPVEWLERRFTTNNYRSRPSYWGVQGDTIVFDTIQDADYDYVLNYVKELSALTSDTATNAWMVEGEELIRTRAKQKILKNYIRGTAARAEAKELAGDERETYRELRSRQTQREAGGDVIPWGPGSHRSWNE